VSLPPRAFSQWLVKTKIKERIAKSMNPLRTLSVSFTSNKTSNKTLSQSLSIVKLSNKIHDPYAWEEYI
jgi:hypothetical protein